MSEVETTGLRKKISVDSLGFDYREVQKDMIKKDEKQRVLFRVGGTVEGVRGVRDNFGKGDQFALVGQFMAVRPDTGEIVQSSTLYIPDGSAHANMVAAAQREGFMGLDFLVDIILNLDVSKKNSVGFEYIAKPVSDAQTVDRAAKLKAALMADLPQVAALPAPKTEKEKA